MGREITMHGRPGEMSDGTVFPAEPLTAVYSDYELATLKDMAERARALPEGSDERAAAFDEIRALHEWKALFDGRFTELRVDEDERASRTEALLMADALAAKGWEISPKVRAVLSEGQTAMSYGSESADSARDAGETGSLPQETGPLPDARPRPDFSEEAMRSDPDPPAWATPSSVSAPESAASRLADFDGETYWRALDHERLGKQLLRVGRQMADGQWHTLGELSAVTGDPEASVSARIRDLRKRKFGGHTVNRERMEGGLWRYRLVREQFATPWGDEQEEVQAA